MGKLVQGNFGTRKVATEVSSGREALTEILAPLRLKNVDFVADRIERIERCLKEAGKPVNAFEISEIRDRYLYDIPPRDLVENLLLSTRKIWLKNASYYYAIIRELKFQAEIQKMRKRPS